jgi:membrane-associated phospholipid phosphatase
VQRDAPAFDRALVERAQQGRSAPGSGAAQAVSLIGAAPVVFLLALGWVLRTGQPRGRLAKHLLLICGGAELLDTVVKEIVQRPRPRPVQTRLPGQQFAFPSGHATVSAAFYSYAAYHNFQKERGRARLMKAARLTLLPLPVGLVRVYLGTHYMTDVLGGYLLGLAWTGGVVAASDLLRLRRRQQRRVATVRPPAPLEQHGAGL